MLWAEGFSKNLGFPLLMQDYVSLLYCTFMAAMDFPGSEVKASAYNAGDPGSIPGLERSPGEGNGTPLQYSCLENPMDGGVWWATVHRVTESQTWLSDFTFTLWKNKVLHSLFYCSLMGIHFVMVSELPFYLFHLLKHNTCQDSTWICCMFRIITFTDGIVYLMLILKGKNYTHRLPSALQRDLGLKTKPSFIWVVNTSNSEPSERISVCKNNGISGKRLCYKHSWYGLGWNSSWKKMWG